MTGSTVGPGSRPDRDFRGGASDDDLRDLVTGVWTNRGDRYSEVRARFTDFEGRVNRPGQKIEMYQIGG